MKKLVFLLLLTLVWSPESGAQIILELRGVPNFNTSGLFVTEAGNDISSVVSETTPSTYMNIRGMNHGNKDYVVYASLAEMQGSITLEVKRISDGVKPSGGIATGNISGGTSPVQLSTTPARFFSGKGDRMDILLGFNMRNLSVTQPAGNVTFSVIFTATDY